MSENTKDENFAKLREKVETLEARESAWKSLAVKGLVGSAGFDPSNKMVELVTEKFAEDLTEPDDVEIDAFGDFAKDYDLAPSKGGKEEPADEDDEDDDEDFSDQMDQFQDQAKGLGKGGGSDPKSKSKADKVAELEREQGFDAAFGPKFELHVAGSQT